MLKHWYEGTHKKILFIAFFIIVSVLAAFGVRPVVFGPSELSRGWITYTVPKSGSVSLGVYDEKGKLVRTLFSGKVQKPGTQRIYWDGTDDQHRAVAAARYFFRGVINPNSVTAEYDFSVGNSGQPAYKTQDGRGSWGGVWGNVMSVAASGQYYYLLWAAEEGQGGLLKLDRTGSVQWKQHLPGSGTASPFLLSGLQTALATDDQYVYIAMDAVKDGDGFLQAKQRQSAIWRVKVADGSYAPFGEEYDVSAAIYPGKSYSVKRTQVFFDLIRASGNTQPHTTYEANVKGLATGAGKLYVALYKENKIEVYNSTTGKYLYTIKNIDRPAGLRYAKGFLYVVSAPRAGQGKVLKISADGRSQNILIAENLEAPYAVTVDSQDRVYVSDLGSSQQIKKFSSTGTLIATYGARGGRLWQGKFSKDDFLFPVGLDVDQSGNVIVSEDSPPRRVAVLNAQGQFVRQWFGPYYYSGNVGVDERHPEYIYLTGGSGFSGPIRFKVDYERKTWNIDSYSIGALWGEFPYEKHSIIQGTWRPMIRQSNGRTYLITAGSPAILKLEDSVLKPSAMIGISLPKDSLQKGWEENPDSPYDFAKYHAAAERNFIWRDANGSGVAEPDEVQQSERAGVVLNDWGSFADQDMNLYIPDWTVRENQPQKVYLLPLQGFDERRNPMYDWQKARVLLEGKFSGEFSLWVDDKKNIYAAQADLEELPESEKREGPVWGGIDLVKNLTLKKFDADGNLLWSTGQKAKENAKPGEWYRITSVSGVTQGFVFFTDVNGQERIYTEDGLYVGSLLEDPLEDYFSKPYMEWWENLQKRHGPNLLNVEHFGAHVFTHPQSKKTYLVAGSDAIHFWQIQGLDTVHRFQGQVK